MKKTVILLLVLSLLLGTVPVGVMAEEGALLYSESFQGYAENATTLSKIQVTSGLDGRVINDNGNKALYVRALGEAVKVSFDIPASVATETIMSAKIKMTGAPTTGKIFNAKFSGGSAAFLNLEDDGTLRLFDNTIVGGVSSSYKQVTIHADWVKKTYDVYMDKKCVAWDWPLPASAASGSPVGMEFAVEYSEGETQLFLDDIRVYDGNVLPFERSFPAPMENSEVLPFTPAEDVVIESDGIIADYNYSESSTGMAYGKVTNEIGIKTLEDGTRALHWYSPATLESKCYADMSIPQLSMKSQYVFDFKLKVNEVSGSSQFGLIDTRDTSGAWTVRGFQIRPGETLKANSGGGNTKIPFNQWVRLSFIYDLKKGKIYIYINGEKASENTTVAGTSITTWRFDVKSPAGSVIDVYFDWMRVYEGDKLLGDEHFSENTLANMEVKEETTQELLKKTTINDPERLKNALSGKSVFITTSDIMYHGGKKEEITDNAQKLKNVNGSLMIPKATLEKINDGKTVSYNSATGEVTLGESKTTEIKPAEENGILYFPLRATVEKLMNKKVSWDERGMVIIADTAVPTRSDVVYTKKHYLFDDYDVIYRYLIFDNPTGKEIVDDVKKNFPNNGHPRVYWTNDDIDYMLEKAKSDPMWQEEIQNTLNYADNILYNDLSFITEFTKRKASGQFKKRITALASAHLLTGDIRYAEKGVEMLKGFAAWEDLKGSQLIMGDWAEGMGIGYDAFYNYMKSTPTGEEDMKFMRDQMMKLIGNPHIITYSKGRAYGYSWITLHDNFNGYIGGGIMCMVLAMCDEEDYKAEMEYLAENVLQSLYVSAELFWPDGGYYEGITYADMEFENYMNGIDAVYNCCGTDYGMGRVPGFTKSGNYFTYLNTPNGEKINFHDDGGGKYYNRFVPEYMGYRYGEHMQAQMGHQSKKFAELEFIINYGLKGIYYYHKGIVDKGIDIDTSDQPLDYYSYAIDTGSFRNSHIEKEPVYVGFHAGYTNVSHDMLDLGEFAFIANGIAWARDLGADSYDLPAYFGKDGYKIYRKKTEGENCLVINPQVNPEKYYGQKIGTRATTIKQQLNKPKGAYSVFDLSPAYGRDAEKYLRGYYFGDDRNTLIVQDEVTLLGESEVYWFMHTPAKIEIVDNNHAVLTKDGKTLSVEVWCNQEGFTLKEMAAAPLPTSPVIEGQNPNEGYTKLALHYPKVSGDVVIVVKLSPEGDYVNTPISYIPINEWTVPDGEVITKPYLKAIFEDGVKMKQFVPGKKSYNVKLPYGTNTVPKISATSDKGNVEVIQATSPNSSATITIKCEGFADEVYKINYRVSNERPVSVRRAIYGAIPTNGILGGKELTAVVSAQETAPGAKSLLYTSDNNLDTEFTMRSANCWLEYDMGEVKNIKGVSMVIGGGNTAPYAYRLLYSEDGTNFKTVYDGLSTGNATDWESLKIPGKARYVRFVGMGDTAAGQKMILKEFKIYAEEVNQ